MISVVSVCLAMCSYVTTTQTCSNLFTWRSPILRPFVLPTSAPPCPQLSPSTWVPPPQDLFKLVHYIAHASIDKRAVGLQQLKSLLVFHISIRRIYLHKTDASSSLVRCSPHKGELVMWSWRIVGMYY